MIFFLTLDALKRCGLGYFLKESAGLVRLHRKPNACPLGADLLKSAVGKSGQARYSQ